MDRQAIKLNLDTDRQTHRERLTDTDKHTETKRHVARLSRLGDRQTDTQR